ncbi:hypothetical protein AB0I51_46195 [Streptomyces sp. NPDC050549]|uniref:hypothetical protein n=1 Tax=Streptomyces sp. NPDC050549 TaxID=3155406 RepID=UPI00343DE727
MTDDSIDALKKAAQVDGDLLHRAELERIAATVTTVDDGEFIHAVTRVCGLSWESGREHTKERLELTDDRSWVDLGTPGNRERLLQAVLAAAIVGSGAVSDTTSVTLAARCLPAVAYLPASSVTAGEAGLRLELRLRPGPFVLPDDLVTQINAEDFREFGEELAASVLHSPFAARSGTTLSVQPPSAARDRN